MITVGIDEVGRGCWAGPLVAGAVILPPYAASRTFWEVRPPKGDGTGVQSVRLRDSKKMSKLQREIAARWVQEHAVAFGLGWVSPADIDRQGLTWAVAAAMERALAEVGRGAHKFDRIIIDGNINYLEKNHMVNHTINTMVNTMVRADDNVPAVSAASIIAKVARDHYMTDLGEKYARYGFDKHVGYGTAAHLAALKQFGVCDLHRRSFKPVQALIGGAAI